MLEIRLEELHKVLSVLILNEVCLSIAITNSPSAINYQVKGFFNELVILIKPFLNSRGEESEDDLLLLGSILNTPAVLKESICIELKLL